MKYLTQASLAVALVSLSQFVMAQGGPPCQGSSCVTTVPESSSLILLAVAAAGFVISRFRR